jgi:hypothetical protein
VPPSAGEWELEVGLSMTAEKKSHIYVYLVKKRYRQETRTKKGRVGHYRCGHVALNGQNGEPGLYLCRNCKAAVDAGAELRIPYRKKLKWAGIQFYFWRKYGVGRGGWNGTLNGKEIGDCVNRDALIARAEKLFQEREREEAMAR